ncbi:hypothetical protein ABDK56_10545 [Sphingomonas sp. ASV193]|uniref:hypothetical protein n=1 Tax=Sphingomonas sp. ASV193 TaxID=3144405 RepID=UPI0032E8A67B
MLGKIFGAVVGDKIAQRYGDDGVKGAVIGAAAPVVARRLFGPLGLALSAGWLAKKAYDKGQARRGAI